MRILAIRGENIASLPKFDIDFNSEPLRSAGLFAITGPTGSGKSSLLDAMCLALFQEAPRLDGVSPKEAKVRGQFGEVGQNDICNLLRRGAGAGWAECEFLGRDGIAYRGRWGYRLPKRTSKKETSIKENSMLEELTLVRLSDGQVLISGNKKTEYSRLVVDLLGLTYNQFTRTVLLAQGRFAEFLKATNDERAGLLETLTGTEIFRKISKTVFQRCSLEANAVRDLESRMAGIERLSEEEREVLRTKVAELGSALVGDRGDLAAMTEIVQTMSRLEERQSQVVASRGKSEQSQERLLGARERLEIGTKADQEARLALDLAEPQLREAERLDDQLVIHVRELDLARADESKGHAEFEQARTALVNQEAVLARLTAEAERDAEWIRQRERLRPVAAEWGQVQDLLDRLAGLRGKSAEFRGLALRAEHALSQSAPMVADLEAHLTGLREKLAGTDPAGIPDALRQATASRDGLSVLRDRTRWELDLAVLSAQAKALELEKSAADQQVAPLVAGLAASLEAVEATRTAASANVQHLRSQLRPGAPCPVCGALEHVLASDGDQRLQELLRTQEAALRERDASLQETRSRVDTLAERSRQQELSISQSQKRLEALPKAEPELASPFQGMTLGEREDALEKAWTLADARRVELEEAQAVAVEVAAVVQKLSELELDRVQSKRTLADSQERLTEFAREIEGIGTRLDAVFGSSTWREKGEQDPVAFRIDLAKRIEEWKSVLEKAAVRERDLATGRERRLHFASSLESLSALCAEHSSRRSTRETELEQVRKMRQELFGGRAIAELRSELVGVRDRAEALLDKIRQEIELVERDLAAFRREIETHAREAEELGKRLSETVPDLAARHTLPWEPDEPVATLEIWSQARTNLDEKNSSTTGELGALQQRLASDAESAERLGKLLRDLEGRRSMRDRWERLSHEIGSADGKKFCVIAQQFTLARLLERADRELVHLAPRYGLRRLGETMSFGVVDHESWDEIRPVHTLSGGETFLVSLALALALSGLSGSAVDVGTLFIDEGFGTLDAQTLRLVMDALSNLQAQGRQVGIITHVEELKELVPVRIEVVRIAPGTSAIQVG